MTDPRPTDFPGASAPSNDDGNVKARAAVGVDQLDYLADMISELREMSHRAGLGTLAGILALAQAEAAQQIANLRRD